MRLVGHGYSRAVRDRPGCSRHLCSLVRPHCASWSSPHPAGPGLRATAHPKVSVSAQTRTRITDIYRRHGTHPGTLGLAHQHPTSDKCTRDGTQPHDGQPSHHLHTASVAVRLHVTGRLGCVGTAGAVFAVVGTAHGQCLRRGGSSRIRPLVGTRRRIDSPLPLAGSSAPGDIPEQLPGEMRSPKQGHRPPAAPPQWLVFVAQDSSAPANKPDAEDPSAHRRRGGITATTPARTDCMRRNDPSPKWTSGALS